MHLVKIEDTGIANNSDESESFCTFSIMWFNRCGFIRLSLGNSISLNVPSLRTENLSIKANGEV